MEDFQNDNIDLLNFINKKCIKANALEPKKIFFLFTKSIRASMFTTYEQQKNMTLTISCTNLIISIFWLVYNYSYNAKLTMFMCERAVLLFNEYINISKNYGNEQTNLVDVKMFIINKTIGPLKLPSKEYPEEMINTIQLSQIYTSFIYKIFQRIIDTNDIYYTPEVFLESILSILSNIQYKLFCLGFTDYITNEVSLLLNYDILDLPREVNILKLKLELIFYSYNKTENFSKSIQVTEQILSANIGYIDETEDINEFFDYQQTIHDKEFFKELIVKLDKLI